MATALEVEEIFVNMGLLDCAWAQSHMDIQIFPGVPTFAALTRNFHSQTTKLEGSVTWGAIEGANFEVTTSGGNVFIAHTAHIGSSVPAYLPNFIHGICDAALNTLRLKQARADFIPFTHGAPKFLAHRRNYNRRASFQTTQQNLNHHPTLLSTDFRDFYLQHYVDGLVCHAR